MSKILKVSQNNYRVQVQSGGVITLDTGTDVGQVVVTGNLIVQGTQTTINTTNLDVEDNIIKINKNQTGDGISAILDYQAGIQIVRGNYSDAKLVFDETVTHYDQNTDSNLPGTFSFQFADGSLASIQTSGIGAGAGSNLNLDMQGDPIIAQIVNADPSSYSLRVTAGSANAIPNKQFIFDYITSSLVVPGVADVDRLYKGHGLPVVIDTEILATSTSLNFYVGGNTLSNQRATITSGGFFVDNINIFGRTITNSSTTSTLKLTSSTTNEVEIDSVLDLTDQTNPVTYTPGMTKLYSKTLAGPGKTGLFLANSNTSDELVSKDRALLFSILF